MRIISPTLTGLDRMSAARPSGETTEDGVVPAGLPLLEPRVPAEPGVPRLPGVPRSEGPSVPRLGVASVGGVTLPPRSDPKPAEAMAVAVARPRVMVMTAPLTSPNRLEAVVMFEVIEGWSWVLMAGGMFTLGLTAAGRVKVTWRPPLVMVSAGALLVSLLGRGTTLRPRAAMTSLASGLTRPPNPPVPTGPVTPLVPNAIGTPAMVRSPKFVLVVPLTVVPSLDAVAVESTPPITISPPSREIWPVLAVAVEVAVEVAVAWAVPLTPFRPMRASDRLVTEAVAVVPLPSA